MAERALVGQWGTTVPTDSPGLWTPAKLLTRETRSQTYASVRTQTVYTYH